MDFDAIAKKRMGKYGPQRQLEKLAEEAAELSAALQGYLGACRSGNEIRMLKKEVEVLGELADVWFCLKFARMFFDWKRVMAIATEKVKRGIR